MIWCDQNEETTSNVPQLLRDAGVPIIVATPPPNQPRFDYIINDVVAVERKEVADYFQSKSSGHLDTQLTDMSTNFSISFVVIVGNVWDYLLQNHTPPLLFYSSYIGCQIKRSLEGKKGVVIVNNVPTEEDFALYLKVLHDKWTEGDFVRLPKFVSSKATPDDIAVNVLCSFRNIGKIKATEILKTYETLGDAFLMLLMGNSWSVKGIGEKTQNHVLKILNNRFEENKK